MLAGQSRIDAELFHGKGRACSLLSKATTVLSIHCSSRFSLLGYMLHAASVLHSLNYPNDFYRDCFKLRSFCTHDFSAFNN